MAKQSNTFDSIITNLRQQKYSPVYMLMGEESYFIDQISDYIENKILSEDDKIFDQTIFYGRDVNIATIINAAKRFPVMAKYQVIIVKEAQDIKQWDDFTFYLQSPQPTTILVFCYKNGSMDKRKKVTSELDKVGVVYESKKLYENQIPNWIISHLSAKKVGIDPKAANLLSSFLGNDLQKISNELDKLIITKPQDQPNITSELIEKNIGISKEFNNFELIDALSQKDAYRCFQIVDYFGKNTKNNPLIVTNSLLFNNFSNLLHYHTLKDKGQANVASELKINPFFVKNYAQAATKYDAYRCFQIISLIRECDVKSKGFMKGNVVDNDLLREMIYKILTL